MLGWNEIQQKWSASPWMKWAKRKPALDKPWDPQRTLWGLKVLAIVVFTAVIIASYRPLSRQLQNYVSEKKAVVITADNVRLVDAPAWMPPGFRYRLQQLIASQFDRDPMDRRGPLLAVRALYESGWIERVDSVQRVAGGVKVRAHYRQPVAFVRTADHYQLIDMQAVRLPGVYKAQQLPLLKLPVIVGAGYGPKAQGMKWEGLGVPAALSLISTLQYEPYFRQVKAVDVSQRDGRGRLRLSLRTEMGQVIWGLPVGEEKHLEPATTLKKQMLMEVYRRKGSIDAGGATVEVFGPAPFVREPQEQIARM